MALLIATVLLATAGYDKNSQINELRNHGVGVRMTVTSCLGLLGGSGSNQAGYACRGSYTIGGRRYNEAIPGDAMRTPGSVVNAVTVPSDPQLVSTLSAVTSERASWRVYLLPAILFLALAISATGIALRRRRAVSR